MTKKDDETIARLEAIVERLQNDIGGVRFGADSEPLTAVGAGGYPGNVVAGELIEAAWGNAVVSSFAQHVRAAAIPGLSANQPLAQTAQYASLSVALQNNKAGSTAIIIATASISTSVAGSAAIISPAYTPPAGGIVNFGNPGVAYMPNTISQMGVPVFGITTLSTVGSHAFFLTGTSSTLNATVYAAPYTGGIAMIIGG